MSKNIVQCLVCNTNTDYLLTKDKYSLNQCPVCHLVFVSPQPDKEVLSNDLYSEKSGYQGNKSKNLDGTIATNKQKQILNWLKKQNKGKLLDVGCSNGDFMWLAKEEGFDVVGVELNKRTADIARANGLNVVSGFIEDAKFDSASFDYVYMGDLIEHLSDPQSLVKEVAALLKPEGKIIIVTPNLDCFWSKSTFKLYKWFGIPWSSLTPPYHLSQFSKNNLDLLMHNNGFNLIFHSYARPPRLLYELGSMHMYKKYKDNKNIINLLFMFFAFSFYTLLYGLNFIIHPFLKKDFQMTVVYSLDK